MIEHVVNGLVKSKEAKGFPKHPNPTGEEKSEQVTFPRVRPAVGEPSSWAQKSRAITHTESQDLLIYAKHSIKQQLYFFFFHRMNNLFYQDAIRSPTLIWLGQPFL